MKKIIAVDGVKKPDSPFNHVVEAGGFLFLTSQLSADLRTNEIIGGTVGEQTRRALENVRLLLRAAGATMDDVVKVVVYMRDIGLFKEMNSAYREYFKEGEEPARTTVQAQSPICGVDVEIDVIAAAPRRMNQGKRPPFISPAPSACQLPSRAGCSTGTCASSATA